MIGVMRPKIAQMDFTFSEPPLKTGRISRHSRAVPGLSEESSIRTNATAIAITIAASPRIISNINFRLCFMLHPPYFLLTLLFQTKHIFAHYSIIQPGGIFKIRGNFSITHDN